MSFFDCGKHLNFPLNLDFSLATLLELSNEDFAYKLMWVLEHQEQAKKIGEMGRLVAEYNFNNCIEAQKVVNVIHK